jgi:hypothetical protein
LAQDIVIDGSSGTVNNGGLIQGYVFGGVAQALGGTVTSAGNRAVINGGVIGRSVYGGYGDTGTAANNTVTMSGGTVNEGVHGGSINSSGDADNNNVVISGGTVGQHVYDGGSWNGGATLLVRHCTFETLCSALNGESEFRLRLTGGRRGFALSAAGQFHSEIARRNAAAVL